MWKQAAVSAFAIAHSIKVRRPLESFLFGFICPDEGGRVARGGSLLAMIPTCA